MKPEPGGEQGQEERPSVGTAVSPGPAPAGRSVGNQDLDPPSASYGVLPRPCRALVLLNPQSGAGRALDDFHAVVQPMLADADILSLLPPAERPHHAQERMREEDLSQWDTLVVMDPPAPPEGGTEQGALPSDSLLAPLGQPVPAGWAVVPEEEFVCVYAIYQSHLGTNLLMAPAARLDDGCIHLFYVRAGISRVALLKVFLAMGRGTHLDLGCPHLHHVPVRAFRLEPRGSAGVMTVDGEALACEPVQGHGPGAEPRARPSLPPTQEPPPLPPLAIALRGRGHLA
uniref:Sphingosine kinase 1 n=1 Tax=Cairina moschata TaxID=8855 RepID=A0A8C3CTE5_CAIMO